MANTFLVTVDSLRRDYLQYMDNTMDFLDNSYDNAYATYPSTIGSFQSILGGIYPNDVGLNPGQPVSNYFDGSTLAFTTNVLTSQKYGYDDGFTYFKYFGDTGIHNIIGRKLPEGRLYTLASQVWGIFLNLQYTVYEPSREFTRAADVIETISKQASAVNQDCFVWVHLMDTHHPYHSEQYSDVSRSEAYSVSKKVIGQNGGSKSEEQLTRKLYKQTVRQLDSDLSKLWDIVSEDDSVVFCADHGEHLGEHNHGHWGHHEYLDETLLNVPFMTKNVSVPESPVLSLIDVPSILVGEQVGQGKYGGREYAYALCDDKKAIITADGTIVTTDDETESHLSQKLEQFSPESVVQQDEALTEDLEALGYR